MLCDRDMAADSLLQGVAKLSCGLSHLRKTLQWSAGKPRSTSAQEKGKRLPGELCQCLHGAKMPPAQQQQPICQQLGTGGARLLCRLHPVPLLFQTAPSSSPTPTLHAEAAGASSPAPAARRFGPGICIHRSTLRWGQLVQSASHARAVFNKVKKLSPRGARNSAPV